MRPNTPHFIPIYPTLVKYRPPQKPVFRKKLVHLFTFVPNEVPV